jgi:prepilin-type processing-associated H-X9-DG protein
LYNLGGSVPKLPYGRCPSDGFSVGQAFVNYQCSEGPQCSFGPCGYDPYAQYCQQPSWGIPWSENIGSTADPTYVRGMCTRLGPKISIASVSDGLSNTIMLGEQLPSQHDTMRFLSPLANAYWASWASGVANSTTIIPINYPIDENNIGYCSNPVNNIYNWGVSWGFKSRHPGGANFAFADGSIRFISQTIDMKTYQLLGCRNDGQPVTLP